MTKSLKSCPSCGARVVVLIHEIKNGKFVKTFCHHCGLDCRAELLRVLDAVRPRDFRVQIIAPNGSIVADRKFGTKDEANRFANENRGERDVAMTQYVDNAANN